MSNRFLDGYGVIAEKINDKSILSGRYSFQQKQIKKIPKDVINKLNVEKDDTCLDIGCNLGLNLIPISQIVKNITGIDEKSYINKLKKNIGFKKNVKLIGGDFLKHDFKNQKFDKILIYSVVHGLKSKKEVYSFVKKAINLLNHRGLLLIGDIPNESLKKRFMISKYGNDFANQWSKKNKMTQSDLLAQEILSKSVNYNLKINDKFILEFIKHYRNKKHSAFILKQNKELPFSNTREDILIEKL